MGANCSVDDGPGAPSSSEEPFWLLGVALLPGFLNMNLFGDGVYRISSAVAVDL